MICRIRAHHGMCMQYYKGSGYSGSFTDNMTRYHELLFHEDPQIMLLAEADDVCAACPNLQTRCPDAARYDRLVLQHCRLQAGDVLRWSEFAALVRESILESGTRERICGDCFWSEMCR